MSANPHGWSQLVDYFCALLPLGTLQKTLTEIATGVDNPVGTGFSTADTNGYALNSQQMAQDFVCSHACAINNIS